MKKELTQSTGCAIDRATLERISEIVSASINYYSASYCISDEDLKDVRQNVMIKIILNYSKYDNNISSLSTWVGRITHNCLIDFLREKSAIGMIPISESIKNTFTADSVYSNPEESFLMKESHEWLERSICGLNPREQRVLRLNLDGNKPAEIAAITGTTSNAARISLFNARKSLRAMAGCNKSYVA